MTTLPSIGQNAGKPDPFPPIRLSSKRATTMNNTDLDLADEDILTCAVSDEALQAAAETERGVAPGGTMAGDHCPP
jgi:hypothetical protein